ncbi:MAG: ABC transporter permease [Candidatus Thorarchaeota archaeon]|nr:MAG: ABC transporter permease [Candidatus Thorarchaeota archaeon]
MTVALKERRSETDSQAVRPKSWMAKFDPRDVVLKILLPVIILILLWEVIAQLSVSSLSGIVESFLKLAFEGDSQGKLLTEHILTSLGHVTLGFLVAALTAIPLGISIGRYKVIKSVFGPVVEAMRPIPPIAWIPISLLLFRDILFARIFIIWIGAFFPILINTTAGVNRTNPVHLDVAETFGATEPEVLIKIIIPSAAPEIFVGFRIGFGIGWMCLIAAEMVNVNAGLGYLVLIMQQSGQTGAMIASMLLIGLIGFLISYFFMIMEKRLLRWRREISV